MNEKISQGHAKILVGVNNAIFLAEKIIKKNFQLDKLKFIKLIKNGPYLKKYKRIPNTQY